MRRRFYQRRINYTNSCFRLARLNLSFTSIQNYHLMCDSHLAGWIGKNCILGIRLHNQRDLCKKALLYSPRSSSVDRRGAIGEASDKRALSLSPSVPGNGAESRKAPKHVCSLWWSCLIRMRWDHRIWMRFECTSMSKSVSKPVPEISQS